MEIKAQELPKGISSGMTCSLAQLRTWTSTQQIYMEYLLGGWYRAKSGGKKSQRIRKCAWRRRLIERQRSYSRETSTGAALTDMLTWNEKSSQGSTPRQRAIDN